MKNNLLSEKLIYTGDSLTPTHIHLCTYNATEMQESSGDTFQSVKATLDSARINWLQVHGLKDTETIREVGFLFEKGQHIVASQNDTDLLLEQFVQFVFLLMGVGIE